MVWPDWSLKTCEENKCLEGCDSEHGAEEINYGPKDETMNSNISTEQQKALLQRLGRLIQNTAVANRKLQESFDRDLAQLKQNFDAAHSKLNQTANEAVEKLDDQYLRELEASRLKFEREAEKADEDRNSTSDDVARRRASEVKQAQYDYDVMMENISRSYDEDRSKTSDQHKQFLTRCESDEASLVEAFESAERLFLKRRCRVQFDEPKIEATSALSAVHLGNCHDAISYVTSTTANLRAKPSNRYLDEGWFVLQFIFSAIAITLALWQLLSLNLVYASLIGTGISLFTSLITTVLIGKAAHKSALSVVPELNKRIGFGRASLLSAAAASKIEAANSLDALKQRRQKQATTATDERDHQLTAAEDQYKLRRTKLERLYSNRIAELENIWNQETETIRKHYGPLIEKTKMEAELKATKLRQAYDGKVSELRSQFNSEVDQLSETWSNGLREFQSISEQMFAFCKKNFPDFKSIDWEEWEATGESLKAVKFGQFSVPATVLSPEIPAAENLVPCPDEFRMPALLSFPELPSLVLNAEGDGRPEAIQVMQNAMLRLLASLPPGKVRFTIIDPVGLGQNFSAFMHLADFDERLVTSRIWTESSHIGQRLNDLTEHMENVIQKYLRNEFESIHEYNDHAGEVAEPFHILVVANFPANFMDETARRLISIVSSGPKCGVYTLLSRDTRLALPRSFSPEDIERYANTLDWKDDRFVWHDEEMREFSVSLDRAPDDDTTTRVLKAVGRQAEDSNRVEVPFANVVPDEDDYWTADSGSELTVALGRAGATRLQELKLGSGTSQHVLISGKTGSGKSTLLHALITNVALHYSPEEVEFYLLDFKKGVEFKPYADFQLPHARVIAIESEREFGMSVLERLDQELRERGDLFRDAGVQSLKAFRKARPDVHMPRILFIVDEFQEYFVNDDKIAHDASLLMDRLVRQGRAFGMHVILGSQTLAGAYSLARSTIGQMAIRIALQCSAADAHLILSEDNTAARLLSRPGEAIYNDANGMFEGNNLFQVVWLTDSQREEYLKQLNEIAVTRNVQTPPPIVFEGNSTADPASNEQLQESLESLPDDSVIAAQAWLGAAIAIKDPTSATFRRQHGSNLLIVGQRDELANGILTSAIVSLSAVRGRRQGSGTDRSIRFALLDGGRSETDTTKFGDRLARALPLDMEVVGPNKAAPTIEKISVELERRNDSDEHSFEPLYLVIFDVARFRDLQQSDDYGFSGFGDDDKPNASSQLANILKDGPPVGIHTIVWADSYNNVSRWFARQTLRDFGMRVLFQMSAVDSSNLMDSAAASHLSPHRAIYYSDERGESEKFRPYGFASNSWLEHVARQLANATWVTEAEKDDSDRVR